MTAPNIRHGLPRVDSTAELALKVEELLGNINASLYATLGVQTSAIDKELKRELKFRKRVLRLFEDEDFQGLVQVLFPFHLPAPRLYMISILLYDFVCCYRLLLYFSQVERAIPSCLSRKVKFPTTAANLLYPSFPIPLSINIAIHLVIIS
jgi:hypothetical protein